MAKLRNVEDANAFHRGFQALIVGIVALFFIPLTIYGFYLDRRLDGFEQSLSYSPPEESDSDSIPARDDVYHLASNLVIGQIVYVPAYSHVYHGSGEPYLLTITLSVRNTSMEDEIVVKSVRYFDTKGKEIKSYLNKPVRLPPLATTEVLVRRDDTKGGSGANFLVEWFAEQPVSEPLIEAVMIDTKSQQGISFARRGSVIKQVVPKPKDSEATN